MSAVQKICSGSERELVGQIALFCIVARRVTSITSLPGPVKTTPPDKGGLEILGTNPLHRVRDVCKESSYCCYLLVVNEPEETRHSDQL